MAVSFGGAVLEEGEREGERERKKERKRGSECCSHPSYTHQTPLIVRIQLP